MERAARLQGHFYLSLKFLIKISLNKKFFPSVKRPRKGASLHVSQKRGTCGNIRPFLKPYLACLSESPVKERSLQVHSYSSFGERCPIPRAFLHSSFSPRNTGLLPGFPTGPLLREMPVSRAFLVHHKLWNKFSKWMTKLRHGNHPNILLAIHCSETTSNYD